jgi:hypothetical protein
MIQNYGVEKDGAKTQWTNKKPGTEINMPYLQIFFLNKK